MGIQVHCEHCRQTIIAPDDSGGKSGKCPHCGGAVYIPMPAEGDEGELSLAPIDEEAERRERKAAQEARALQYQLLHEQGVPGEPSSRKNVRLSDSTAPASAGLPVKELNRLVVHYVEAMAGGKLDEAEKIIARLTGQRLQVLTILDNLATEELSAYGLPALPRPVLLGFLKQLRSRLQQGPM